MKRELGAIQVAAELALLGVTVATVLGFTRLFADGDFLAPLLAAAVCSHVTAAAARRAGWGIGRAGATSLIALALVITWSLFWDTTFAGLPTGETIDGFRVASDEAWAQFREVVAPAPTLTGFVLALMVGVWAGAFLADWAAFRLWSPIEAIVPMTALFVFAALLGEESGRTGSTVLFIVAVTAFELLHRVARQAREGRWVNNDLDRGINALVLRGAVLGLGAVAVGSLLAPGLPMADDPPVVDWRGAGGDESERTVASPLVTIDDRLIDQGDIELFTVRAAEPAYWRLTSLDIFDGQIWRSAGTFEEASGTLPRTSHGEPEGTPVRQSYSIDALSSPWLPAAYEPRAYSSATTDAVYESDTSTLIVPHDRDDSNGAEYEIESIRPTFDPDSLRDSSEPIPDDITERFLQLPGDFSPFAEEQARLVTASGTTHYDKALILQEWFRNEFTYDLDVDLAHDMSAMEAFLDQRRGYCQQFAGTYAAMARSLGIPSRVAVGFTWGERDAVDPDLWHVSGRQAHAWVEVFIPGTGWVDFDPTPGRGAPGSVAWTQHEQEQDVAQRETAGEVASTTTIDPTGADAAGDPSAEELAQPVDAATTGDAGGLEEDGRRLVPIVVAAGLFAVILMLLVGGTTAVIKLRRRRARRRLVDQLIEESDTPVEGTPEQAWISDGADMSDTRADIDTRAGIQAAWDEIVDRLGAFGLSEHTAETQSEFVDRAAAVSEFDPTGAVRLAERVDEADFGLIPPPPAALRDARATMTAVEAHVTGTTTRWDRFLRLIDPRALSSAWTDRSG